MEKKDDGKVGKRKENISDGSGMKSHGRNGI